MENLRKKNETEIQNTMEGPSSRIEQTEVFCFEIYFEINALRHNREYA
jgi:hypothetical protein